ncbi:class I SAM-dependent methyltransferase [Novosphingobium mangrovi (ex Huang et al. 2023)]|uniref:SAM-dependent methyltransferase n=1 Tax=Novosphingobium mangrovi (ex Huang et al. 2023) TaxID=2976432 RepID=A0ABT2I3C3_9SPHN|nr:SAM-dependent methyltransferase [Novosphingobium mangrovi (ex Huang et al. 2023)]MCT2399293.1 SAM-dependent methyltransferase [Novosphingobium mangrovi (ex Huang et al. 2023)]
MAGGAEPLAAIFRRLIASYGPITLLHYMGESNARYYADKDPLGSAGDFITAPEISQMFGELVGLWLADIWIRAGRDERAHYVELGPGRGTLARDALRVMKRFGLEPQVHFVEGSAALRDIQLAGVPQAHWHHDLASLPEDGPLLVVANEFLDALPVRQLVKTPQGWRERMVDYRDGRFLPVAGDKPMDAAVPEAMRKAEDGTLIETCPGASTAVSEIAARLVDQGGAALFIDYGHDRSRTGSTLQALKAHAKVDPFELPGEADLTCHVDFAAMADAALPCGARHLGTVTQRDFLRGLGIEERAGKLAASAPQHAAAIQAGKDRLIAEEQMGTLFKVMGLASPDWPDGAGF